MFKRFPILFALIIAGLSCTPGEPPAEVSDRPSEGTVVVDGAELRWVREGEGPVLFLIGSSIYYRKAYSAGLRDHFEMVFVDGRHFVPSYAPGNEVIEGLTMSTFADDVEAIRLELGYDEITVVGHSVQGQIALDYADRYPATCSGVVLIGPVPYSLSEFSAAADEVWDRLASPERKALLAARQATEDSVVSLVPPERAFAVGYAHMSPLYFADPEYDASEVFAGLESGPAFGQLISSVPSATEVRSRLERIQAPILLVLGRLDFAIPYTAWDELIEGLPNIEYVLLEEDSHNPQTESPERFDPVLLDWASRR